MMEQDERPESEEMVQHRPKSGPHQAVKYTPEGAMGNGAVVKWMLTFLVTCLMTLIGVVYANIKSDMGQLHGEHSENKASIMANTRSYNEHEAQLREMRAINHAILQRLDSIDKKLGR